MKWYYERGNGQDGPVTRGEIRAMIADGTLAPENKVWCKEFADWTAVALLPDLHPAAAPEPEPEPEPVVIPGMPEIDPVVTEAAPPAGPPRAKQGSIVWAEWTENSWYHGVVDRVDGDDALSVAFDDGDQAVVSRDRLAIDSAPDPKHVQVGTRVLASWMGDLYPARVSSVSDGHCQVNFDDGDTGASAVHDLRLIGR